MELYFSVFLTPPLLLRSLPSHAPAFVWCWGSCFKRQLLFLPSGKLSSFTSPEMKAESRRRVCSLISSQLCRRTMFPMLPSDWTKEFSCCLSFEECKWAVVTEWVVREVGLSGAVHWVSDVAAMTQFVCLITERSVYFTEPMESLCSVWVLVLHTTLLTNYTLMLKRLHRLTVTSLFARNWKKQNKKLVIFSCKKGLNFSKTILKLPSLFPVSHILNLSKLVFHPSCQLPKLLSLHNSGLPSSGALQ